MTVLPSLNGTFQLQDIDFTLPSILFWSLAGSVLANRFWLISIRLFSSIVRCNAPEPSKYSVLDDVKITVLSLSHCPKLVPPHAISTPSETPIAGTFHDRPTPAASDFITVR